MSAKPGCFGSVLYHDEASRRCSVCPIFAGCKEAVGQTEAALKTWATELTVASKSATRKTRKMVAAPSAPIASVTSAASASATTTRTTTPDPATAHLNVKAREFVDRWNAKGVDYKAYKTGVNGFQHCGNKFAAVAMQFFMDNPSGVTRIQLVDELIDKAGARGPWGMGTAASHANFVLEAFEHLGIITQTSGKAYLR